MDPKEPQDEKEPQQLSPKKPLIFYGIIAIFLLLIPIIILVVSIYFKSTGFKRDNLVETIDYFRASYVPDQLIVKLKDEYTEGELQNLKSKFEELGVIGQKSAYESKKEYLKNYYILQFRPGTDLRHAKAGLDKTGAIVDSHPNYIFKIQAPTPNDPLYSQQWDFAKIDMPNAWVLTHGSNNIKVAILDTGIDYNHPDFAVRAIIRGPNYITGGSDPYDGQGHGTHVAGTIGAVTNNSVGIAGANWNVTLVIIKSQDNTGNGKMSDIIKGIQYAIEKGANVINMSLTSVGEAKCTQVQELQATINDAVAHNIVVAVAAGNGGHDASLEVPPSCNGVIVVGATDQNDKRSIFPSGNSSNYGARVDISAPGSAILSTYKNGQYVQKWGTSQAAPHVAGVAALLLSLNPGLTPQQVRDCLVNNADPITQDPQKTIGPRLNAFKALNACSGRVPITPGATATGPTTVPTQAVPTSTVSGPTGVTKKKPTPIPVTKYTCREQTGPNTPSGAIQIGSLVCTPNP